MNGEQPDPAQALRQEAGAVDVSPEPAWRAEKDAADALDDGTAPWCLFEAEPHWAEFKAWAEMHMGQGYSLAVCEGMILDPVTHSTFRGYQAGKAASGNQPEAPEPDGMCPGCNSPRSNGPCCEDCSYRLPAKPKPLAFPTLDAQSGVRPEVPQEAPDKPGWRGSIYDPRDDPQREPQHAQTRDRELLAWAYSKLAYRSFDSMDDALAMDEIKLILTGAQG